MQTNSTVEMSADDKLLEEIKAKRAREAAMFSGMPEDEADSPNVCIACQ